MKNRLLLIDQTRVFNRRTKSKCYKNTPVPYNINELLESANQFYNSWQLLSEEQQQSIMVYLLATLNQ